MCICLAAINTIPNYPIVLIHNRDEFHQRSSEPAKWRFDNSILCGLDTPTNSTWLGINKFGIISLVTNLRVGWEFNSLAKSRGKIVVDHLTNQKTFDQIRSMGKDEYNPFSFLSLQNGSGSYFSSLDNKERVIHSGVFTLSNSHLNSNWPKNTRLKSLFLNETLQKLSKNQLTSKLFQILQDSKKTDKQSLPRTGIPLEYEETISSIFVRNNIYGTRVSTIILIDQTMKAHYFEVSYNNIGIEINKNMFYFNLICNSSKKPSLYRKPNSKAQQI